MRRVAAVLPGFLAITALPAAAETPNCADRATIVERLSSGYGENFAGGGVRNAQSIFEVWFSDESGTWTILMTTPDGRSCVMAAGTNWRRPHSDPDGILN